MSNTANRTFNSILPLGVTDAIKNVGNNVANIGQNVMNNGAKLTNNFVKATNTVLPQNLKLPEVPTNFGAVGNVASNVASGATSTIASLPWLGIVFFLIIVLVLIIVIRTFSTQIRDGYDKFINQIRSTLGYPSNPPAPVETTTPTTAPVDVNNLPAQPNADTVVEKILPPGGAPQVFNISKNTFTYYDAEPLCRALGAELATYEQVKDAWEKGADWCNYGWTKGQMAVYPTQKETWEKLQLGPEEQRLACGKPGLNGGFFDNPELRYGVNCYGSKPSQSAHDATQIAQGAPTSPGALEFDKKVASYRSQMDSIGVMPFNSNKWSA